MTTALVYLVVMVVVGAVLFLVAALVFGRGEELAPLPRGTTATVLPDHDVTGDDVRRLRFRQVVRGYQASEVDWVLDRLAAELERLSADIDELRTQPQRSVAGSPDAEVEGAERH